MLALPPDYSICAIWVDNDSLTMSITCQKECKYFSECLKQQEQEELAMVKLSDASANPEAMMIKLAYASVAFPAVT